MTFAGCNLTTSFASFVKLTKETENHRITASVFAMFTVFINVSDEMILQMSGVFHFSLGMHYYKNSG